MPEFAILIASEKVLYKFCKSTAVQSYSCLENYLNIYIDPAKSNIEKSNMKRCSKLADLWVILVVEITSRSSQLYRLKSKFGTIAVSQRHLYNSYQN